MGMRVATDREEVTAVGPAAGTTDHSNEAIPMRPRPGGSGWTLSNEEGSTPESVHSHQTVALLRDGERCVKVFWV